MNDKPIEVTVVMPCLNEAATLETCILKARKSLSENGICGEIVIGDNGSIDGSQKIAARNGARIIDISRKGYGAALCGATSAARGKYVIMGDSDDSYDFSDLMPFIRKLREGYDLVMGNRFLGGIKKGAMPWKNRYIGNPVLSLIGRILFKCPAGDFHCGLRGFSMEAFRKMDLHTTGMEYASEMVIKSTLLGLKITEVPTTLSPDGRSRPPHLRPWRDGLRHLEFMLLYSPRWLFLIPGFLLALAGLVITLALAPGARTIGGIEFDTHTMIFGASFILIGFQSMVFYLFTKFFADRMNLYPLGRRRYNFIRKMKLSYGVLTGLVFTAMGTSSGILAVRNWVEQSFGAIYGSDTLRLAIISVLALTLGIQIILNSLFLSILKLKTK